MDTDKIRKILQKELLKRKALNGNYSIRTFAKDLGIGKTTLSDVLNGRRSPSKKNLEIIIFSLAKSEKEYKELSADLENHLPQKRKIFKVIDEEDFEIISDWEYMAILNLVKIRDHIPTAQWVSNRLGIDLDRAETCIHNLIKFNYLEIKDHQFQRINKTPLSTKTEIPAQAIKKHHSQSLHLAEDALYNVDVKMREFLSGNLAIDIKDMDEAKDMIFEFYRSFTKKYESQSADEVFKFNVQFFPCRSYEN